MSFLLWSTKRGAFHYKQPFLISIYLQALKMDKHLNLSQNSYHLNIHNIYFTKTTDWFFPKLIEPDADPVPPKAYVQLPNGSLIF